MEQLSIVPDIGARASLGTAGIRPKGDTVSSSRNGTFEAAFRAEGGRIGGDGTPNVEEEAPDAGLQQDPESQGDQVHNSVPGMPLFISKAADISDEMSLALGMGEPTAAQGGNETGVDLLDDAASGEDAAEAGAVQSFLPWILLAALQTGRGDPDISLQQIQQPSAIPPDGIPSGATEPPGGAQTMQTAGQAAPDVGPGASQGVAFGSVPVQQNPPVETPIAAFASNSIAPAPEGDGHEIPRVAATTGDALEFADPIDQAEIPTAPAETQGNTPRADVVKQGQTPSLSDTASSEQGPAVPSQVDTLAATSGQASPPEATEPQAIAPNNTPATQGAAVASSGQNGSEIHGNASIPGGASQLVDLLQNMPETTPAGKVQNRSARTKESTKAERLEGPTTGRAENGKPPKSPIVEYPDQGQTKGGASASSGADTPTSVEDVFIEEQAGLVGNTRANDKARPVQSQTSSPHEGPAQPDDAAPAPAPGETVSGRSERQDALPVENGTAVGTVSNSGGQDTTDGPEGVQRAESQTLNGIHGQVAETPQNRAEARSGVEQTKTVQQLGDEIIRTVTLKKDRAVIQLYPPELGKVRIHLTLSHGNELRAVFVADTREAKLIIENHIEALRAHLDQRGLTMTDCNVDMNSNQGFSLRQQNDNSQAGLWWGRSGRPFTPTGQDDAPEAAKREAALTGRPNGRLDLVI